MRSTHVVAAAVLVAVLTAAPHAFQGAVPTDAPEYGPARGTLIIVGGGNLNGSGINEKFIELAGGEGQELRHRPDRGRQPERGRLADCL